MRRAGEVSIAEVVAATGAHADTVRRWAIRGEAGELDLRVRRDFGGRYWFDRRSLAAFLERSSRWRDSAFDR